jgi:hypothetical protein
LQSTLEQEVVVKSPVGHHNYEVKFKDLMNVLKHLQHNNDKNLPVEEKLFQLPGEEQRIHHEYLYHWLSKFCRNSLLAVCLQFPTLQDDKPLFALPESIVIGKSLKVEFSHKIQITGFS